MVVVVVVFHSFHFSIHPLSLLTTTTTPSTTQKLEQHNQHFEEEIGGLKVDLEKSLKEEGLLVEKVEELEREVEEKEAGNQRLKEVLDGNKKEIMLIEEKVGGWVVVGWVGG